MVFAATILAALLILVIILQVRAYYLLQKQTGIIVKQSQEIKSQNEALARQNELLQDVNAEKQQLIGVVSHDLKGPFNRIFALVQLLKMSDQNLGTDQRELVGKIHQSAVDGLNMVRNLLDSRELEEQGLQMKIERVMLAPFISAFINNYTVIADQKSISLSFVCPEGLEVMTDKLFITRILDNLLSNAIKFSPEGKKIEVLIEADEDSFRLIVKDQGPGISPDDQKKLFRKFQQLSAKPTAGESSTGLGLSIVKSLTEMMGATVQCESTLNEGTSFIVTLNKMDASQRGRSHPLLQQG